MAGFNRFNEPLFLQAGLEVNGGRFSCLYAGNHKDPLVLCLHGFPDTNRTFRHLLPALAGAGFYAVAPNMRGVWPTQVIPGQCYNVAVMALDAIAIIQYFGKQSASIVGHGWGALGAFGASQISYDFHLGQLGLAPKTIDRVVSISESYGRETRDFARSDRQEIKRSRVLHRLLEDGAALSIRRENLSYLRQVRAAGSPGWRGDADELDQVISAYKREGALESAVSFYTALSKEGYSCGDRTISSLRKVMDRTQVPAKVMILCGENDGLHTQDYFFAAPSELFLCSVRTTVMGGLGHYLHLEDPGGCNRAILRFLGEESSRTYDL